MSWYSDEAILLSPHVYREPPAYLFKPAAWPECAPVSAGGRGSAWFVGDSHGQFVLRHFRRGGLVSRVLRDQFAYRSAENSRAFREYTLLDRLHCLGLPVPEPVAAHYSRRGLIYRADILTVRLPDTRSLASLLSLESLSRAGWRALGRLLRRFHNAGAFHADLNAHNILCDPDGSFYLIDFDRGDLRQPGDWCVGNIQRLKRSLDKLARIHNDWHADADDWQALLDGYESGNA